MAAKFDIISALEENGFELDRMQQYDEYRTVKVYRKNYSRVANVAWYGEQTLTYWAEVRLEMYRGKVLGITGTFAGGKVKEYMCSDKAAFNAIKKTVELAGYEF